MRATAQDGSGYATAWLGSGKPVRAPAIPRPNLFALTKSMNSMGMGRMAPGKLKLNGPDTTSQGVILARNARDLEAKGGGMAAMGHGGMDMSMPGMDMSDMPLLILDIIIPIIGIAPAPIEDGGTLEAAGSF